MMKCDLMKLVVQSQLMVSRKLPPPSMKLNYKDLRLVVMRMMVMW